MHFVHTYWIFFYVVSYASADDEKATYEASQVWQTKLRGAGDIILIKKIIDNQDVSVWRLSPSQADFLVKPQNMGKVQQQLLSRNLSYTVLIPNVQRTLDEQATPPALWNENTLRIGHRLNWRSYPPLHIIEEFYNFLAEDYSSICKIKSIGRTVENRTIKMINITNGDPSNKVMLIIAGLHGREWVSVTSALYILHTIVTKFDHQADFIKSKNWLIIPVANPDGYRFSHTHNRFWRKNRRKFIYCNGADVNRNFELDWGIAGITENNECRDAYSGPYPFSEAETVAIREVISNVKEKPVTALIDLHSYGNLILYPWSARSKQTLDFGVHNHTAEGMAKAITEATKEKYSYGPTYHKIYPATGALLDWAYSQGVKHSYAIESRDTGRTGFLLPPEQIEDTGKELYAAVKYLAKALDPPVMRRGDEESSSWF